MAKSRDDILKEKEILAQDSLLTAKEALSNLSSMLDECSARDLIAIFAASVKAHRDITSDIVAMNSDIESKSEQQLAKDYEGKVGELLKKFTSGD